MTSCPRANKFRALSLIEPPVVIALISVFAVLAPAGLGGGESQGLLIGQIQSARNVALARNEPCRLLVEADESGGRRIGIVVRSPSGRGEWAGAVHELPQEIAILVPGAVRPAGNWHEWKSDDLIRGVMIR